MRPEGILRAVAAIAGALLTITLLTMAVTVLDVWWAVSILIGVIVLAVLARTLVRKRVPRGTVLEIDLDGGVVEKTGSDPISRALTRHAVTLRDVVDSFDRAAGDSRVTGLVARLGNGGIDVGHAQELRDAVRAFRQSGKKAIAFAEAFGEGGAATVDYYLATAFNEIYLQPKGLVSVEGLLAKSTFVRGVFDKFGLIPDFDHRKEYKAAKYRLTETRFTEPHREALEAVAGDRFSQIVSGIAADRGLDVARVEQLIDSAPLTTEEAVQAGLVDHMGYRDEAYEAAGPGSGFMFHDKYLKRAGRPNRKGRKIALIYGTGSINRGGSRFDPLTGSSSFGADDVAKAFRLAVDDAKVEAIVFRVDSPGGSAVASEIVSHEVTRARDAGKPVIVSMANVAGSGGYWVSAGADKIVALPGTITGSIGVVWGKLANREAWSRIGVTFDQIPFGRNATFGSSQDPFTDTERDRLTALIDDIYDEFVSGVASGRDLTHDRVEEIAKGRIWTGAQARENGLVDELGGLKTAIELAREAAGIEPGKPARIAVYPPRRTLPIPERKDSSEPVHAAVAALIDILAGIREDASGARARMAVDRLR